MVRLKTDYHRLGPDGFPDIVERHGLESVKVTGRRLGGGNPNRPLNKEDVSGFKNITSPAIAYLLGFLWADGHVCRGRNRIMLLIGEQDGKQLKNLIRSTANGWYSRSYNGYGKAKDKRYINYAISNYDLRQCLVELDYHIKSDIAPNKVLSVVPKHLLHYWWRGYFDGDGCIYFNAKNHSKKVQITASYDYDWSFAERLFKSLSVNYSFQRACCERGCRSSIVTHSHGSIRRFMEYIYSGKSFGLKRKGLKYEAYLKHYADKR